MRSAEFHRIAERAARIGDAERALYRLVWPAGWPSAYVEAWLSLRIERRTAEKKLTRIIWC